MPSFLLAVSGFLSATLLPFTVVNSSLPDKLSQWFLH